MTPYERPHVWQSRVGRTTGWGWQRQTIAVWQTGQPPGEPGQQPWEGMISESWTEAEHVALFLHLALLFINSLSVHQAGLVVLLSRPPGQRSHTTLQHLLLKFQAQQTCRADLGLAATTAATQLFFQRFFFSQGNVFVSRTPCSCVSVCPVSSDGGGGVVVCGGPSPTVTDRLSQVSRNCSQAPSVGIRSLLLPVWGGGDISRSRTDNRQHQAVTTNLTLQTTNTASTPAKLQILSINTTMLGIFTSTIFLIKARHVVKRNMERQQLLGKIVSINVEH